MYLFLFGLFLGLPSFILSKAHCQSHVFVYFTVVSVSDFLISSFATYFYHQCVFDY